MMRSKRQICVFCLRCWGVNLFLLPVSPLDVGRALRSHREALRNPDLPEPESPGDTSHGHARHRPEYLLLVSVKKDISVTLSHKKLGISNVWMDLNYYNTTIVCHMYIAIVVILIVLFNRQ